MQKIKTTNNIATMKQSKFVRSLPLTMLALPGIILLILFRYLPMFGLVLPFKNMSDLSVGFFNSAWCGLENFKFVFASVDALIALRNTILYNTVFIIVTIVICVSLALMLFELRARHVKFYQTVIFLPYFVSWVVGAFVVKGFLDMDYGVINNIRGFFGLGKVMWYSDAKYWPWVMLIVNTWKKMGYDTIMYYAALMSIDTSYFEAAKIDGAGKLRTTFSITIPMIKNTIIILFILHIGKIMYADFGLFYNVPMNISLLRTTTDVLDTYVFRTLTQLGDVGMSAAAAFFQSVVGFILVILTNLIVRKFDKDSALF